ncbi:hypothetical protein [Nostoc sp. TCL26-01]|uniref:hypothetical protein n=1 Tax=Nostoc sp. TCL26-01 TaxID=2576904 RepID=UPI0015C19A88|nr:hypothetical protein [Nostoc sp. TCL26-01]QLE55680.1 hypothetical protein FD725_09210 [Nostoc sp. TCL26-01]
MKKTILLTFGFLSLLIVPATAQLGRVWADFQYYSTDLQNYWKYNLSETLKPLESSSQNALNGATGDLNIPNPVEAGDQVRRDLIFFNSIPDKFENNQAIRSVAVNNEINRLMTRSSVVGSLGRDGQTRLKNKLEYTEKVIESIDEIIQQAENNSQNLLDQITGKITGIIDPTQNALASATSLSANNQAQLQLQILKVQGDQVKLNSEALAQTIQTNQYLQYTNLNLANLSQQMEETNRARRVDTSAEAARLLRTTAQIDLFGRKLD